MKKNSNVNHLWSKTSWQINGIIWLQIIFVGFICWPLNKWDNFLISTWASIKSLLLVPVSLDWEDAEKNIRKDHYFREQNSFNCFYTDCSEGRTVLQSALKLSPHPSRSWKPFLRHSLLLLSRNHWGSSFSQSHSSWFLLEACIYLSEWAKKNHDMLICNMLNIILI